MKQKIKQFQRYVENNSIFYVVVTLLSMVFPCMMIAFFYKYNDLPLLNFFWTAFYSILGNVVLFHKKTICRIILILINIIPLLFWYYIFLMGGLRGLLLGLYCSIVPFFMFIFAFFNQ